jgi:transcriptional regulator with XRE-family HTH domain
MIDIEVIYLNADFIRERITELRMKKGISEHRMSLDLGHARSYIHGITAGRTLPSMTEFLAICDYFEITPEYFFKEDTHNGVLLTALNTSSEKLSEEDLAFITALAKRLAKK